MCVTTQSSPSDLLTFSPLQSTPNPAPAMPPSIPGATDDEEAAIAAMFQTQTANWEEAQEKLSQSVSLAPLHVVASFLMHAVFRCHL